MHVIIAAVGAALLVAVVALAVPARRGRTHDLVATQLSAVAVPGSIPEPAGPSAARPDLDAGTVRRIGELVAANRRLAAIELVRQSTGCGLGEAKILVDRLTGARRPG